MKREDLPAWAIAMGVMSDEDLEQSRQVHKRERAEDEARKNLGRYSPRRYCEAEWNEKKARWRST